MAAFTKKAIINTFVELLNEVPFDKITVKDIVERCGINRNTFYYHYKDIYDLLTDVLHSDLSRAVDNSQNYDTWEKGLVDALSFAIKNKKAVYHIYNSANREILKDYFRDIIKEITAKFILREAGTDDIPQDDLDFLGRMLDEAVMGIFEIWMEEGMTEGIETKVACVQYLFKGMTRQLVEKMRTPEYKIIKNGGTPQTLD
ncbi:MAG: TetR/AcrR family transcriptional regulator [Lachnospiraceae bacterium]|nr:TetR/AcrR family transcriptional regulator [Lachnospiraceae bacterium]